MMLDQDYDYRAAVVKVTNTDHPDGFVLMNDADVKQRRADRADAKKRGDDPDDVVGPEFVVAKDKPADKSDKGGAPPPAK